MRRAASDADRPRGARTDEDRRQRLQEQGRSGAAWTTVGIVLVSELIIGAGLIVWRAEIVLAGVVVGVVGLAIGRVLSAAGYGRLPSYSVQAPAVTDLEGPDRSHSVHRLDSDWGPPGSTPAD